MIKNNIEVVEKLPNGKLVVKIEREIAPIRRNLNNRKVIKYTIANDEGIVPILDLNNNLTGIQFFDSYYINKEGDIIIGITKDGKEYYDRILSSFDLSSTQIRQEEARPFNDGRAVVCWDSNYGYIDCNKIMIDPENKEEYANNLSPRFFEAQDFENGQAVVTLGSIWTNLEYAIINTEGKIIEKCSSEKVKY